MDIYFLVRDIRISNQSKPVALAHLGERQTEAIRLAPANFGSKRSSGGTVFDPQKRQQNYSFCQSFPPNDDEHAGWEKLFAR